MLNLQDTVRQHCADVDPTLVETHFRRLPASYYERYSPTEIARHLHLLARIRPDYIVEVEIRPLASHAFEVLVVGVDHPGTMACVTAALASHNFNLEDVHVAPYLVEDAEPGIIAEPCYFVIMLRMSGGLRQRSIPEVAGQLRDRLQAAFFLLAEGKIREAQCVASDVAYHSDHGKVTPSPSTGATVEMGQEGLLLAGDFRLEKRLAVGGMSEVYQATQVSLNRTVAVKLIRQDAAADADISSRFQNEGQVLGRFTCPYIVQILAAGSIHSRAGVPLGWMAMEYMAGGDLALWQKRHGRPPLDQATRWLRDSLEGLAYAHRQGILHRDIKPHNLLLTSEGHVKVSDFGLLKNTQTTLTGLTPHAAIMGTPHYMAPEQALGENLDERSDIFSLGSTFFHLFSSRLPFDKSSATAVLVQIAQQDAPRLTEVWPEAPAPFNIILGRMMARRREERYQDVSVILEDLASYERRGLLRGLDSVKSFPSPSQAWDAGNAETQMFMRQPQEANDLVI